SITDGRPGQETYAMVMFQKRITPERLEILQAMGCRTLGFHPHYTIKVAVPTDRVLDVSVLDFVRWVGAPRTWQKVHTALSVDLDKLTDTDPVDVYISVFESDMGPDSTATPFGSFAGVAPNREGEFAYEGKGDPRSKIVQSNGWMQLALEAQGVTIHEYRPDIDTFRATIPAGLVPELCKLDFVQFLEPVPEDMTFASPFHDESIPMVNGDYPRGTYDGSFNSRAQVGLVDSGVEFSHQDISGIFGWGWNCTTEASAWDDIENGGTGHGTHVTGTILGRGNVEADHTGMAPGLATFSGDYSYYNYRKFPNCSVGLSSIATTMSSPVGTGHVPQVINNSWGSWFTNGTFPTGSEADARTMDTVIYDEGQTWVYAMGNFSTRNIGIQAAAKNVIAVGNVVDYDESTVGTVGDVWSSSGAGPTADGRFKPNVVAPGRWVSSCLANNNTGYAAYSGTSMAAPHVTGLLAQLIDHYTFFDFRPDRNMSHLMATAVTRDDVTLITPNSTVGSHLNTQGAGRIDGYKAHYTNSNWGWLSYSTTISSGGWAYGDFNLPVGTTRMVAVMSYNEEAASAGAGSALVNDYDFVLDRDPIDPGSTTGEYFAQQSSVDNSELRILNSPTDGAWRWKVFSDSTTSSCRVTVTIFFMTCDTTPTGNLSLTAADGYVQTNEVFDVTATVDPNDYLASSVLLDMGGTMVVDGRERTLGDGIVSDLSQSGNSSDKITLGDVYEFTPRSGTWNVHYTTEGTKTVSMAVTSDNMVDASTSVQVVVDGTQPGAVTNLTSPSHTAGQWSSDPTIQWTWTAASDNLSGIQGYGIFETTAPNAPSNILDIGAVTTYTSAAYASSTSPRYFNIRSVDNSDNWDSDYVSAGPYYIDATPPSGVSFVSSSIPVGSSSCDHTVLVNWTPSVDSHSGVAGYSYVWSSTASYLPNLTVNTTTTGVSNVLPNGTWYLHVRPIDVAGNGADSASVAHFGPITITPQCGTAYCSPANLNSLGISSTLTASGSDRVAINNLTLSATNMPLNQFGYFVTGTAQGPAIVPPGSQGNFCLGGAFGRYNQASQIFYTGATGSFQLTIDVNSMPTTPVQAVLAGQTWQFQAWHRDQNPFNTSNFTNGLSVQFK
ncbi:MAG TPA: S8 family serine peptidase, partial [Planctomycetota bacterium]|nr:S8 family serine peptidase [Planctomycetota bacterium]